MKTVIAVLAVVLAIPAGALAADTQPKAFGTDVAAPDQQNPIAAPAHLPATGTDVAAADQQAPVVAAVPAPISVAHADGGFDWSDAGVGALTGALVVSASLGAAVSIRRRQPAPSGA